MRSGSVVMLFSMPAIKLAQVTLYINREMQILVQKYIYYQLNSSGASLRNYMMLFCGHHSFSSFCQ